MQVTGADIEKRQLQGYYNKKICAAKKKGDEERRMARYCRATGGGPGPNPLDDEDGDEVMEGEVDPRLLTGSQPVVDDLCVVNVPAGGMFSASQDGALGGLSRQAPPVLFLEDNIEEVNVILDGEGFEELPSPIRHRPGPSSIPVPFNLPLPSQQQQTTNIQPAAAPSSSGAPRWTPSQRQQTTNIQPAAAPSSSGAPRWTPSQQQQTTNIQPAAAPSQLRRMSQTPAATASSGDHSYLPQSSSVSRKKSAPKNAPSNRRPSSKSSEEGQAYRDLMQEKQRILRLEAKILLEAKKKEAEYWHLMKLKLMAEITGVPVDTSEVDMTPGPLLTGEFAESIDIPDSSTSDRIVNIVCTYYFGVFSWQ